MTALASPATRYALSGDVHIAYQVVDAVSADTDLDIVVAPGFVSHLDLQWTMPGFAAFVRGLTRFGRVILFDKRGTGLSDPAPDADRFDRRVDDIVGVMDAARSERAVLLGISEGGPLAALFAATHPARVRALVLYGTFARGAVIPPATMARFEEAVSRWGDGLTADIFVAPDEVGPMVRNVTGLFERASLPPGLARSLLRSIGECDVRSALAAVTSPTLVLQRIDDPFARPRWARELADAIDGATLVELPGDSHLPWIGDSSDLIDHIERFTTGSTSSDGHDEQVLGTVLFTDIVGSTPLAAELGDSEWARLLDAHNGIVRRVLAAYRGVEVDRTGDGFFAFFDAPSRGVECARALSHAVRPLGLQIRAGLHTGPCRLVDVRSLAGLSVHIGARIGSMAGPSEVLASSTVADLCTGSTLRFEPVGPTSLTGVPEPVDVVRLLPDDRRPDIDAAQGAERRLRRPDRLSLAIARAAPRALRAAARVAGARV
ncbi:MAG: alpha/beta fold hydrolase [Actinomycetota bacterium]